MKRGISFWSMPMDGSVSVAEGFQWAKKAGFDGVELLYVPDEGLWGIRSSTPEGDIAAMAEDSGLELANITLGPKWCRHLLTSKDPAARIKATDSIRQMVEIAHNLKIRTVLAVSGGFDFSHIDPSWSPCREFLRYDESYDAAVEGFLRVAPFAEEAGVIVAIENIASFLSTPIEYRRFIETIGSEFVRSLLDIGNVMMIGNPVDWIYAVGDLIANVHVKDYRRNSRAFVDLLAGDIDWPAAMRALCEVGYDGYMIAEMKPVYTYYPDQLFINTAASMARIIDGR